MRRRELAANSGRMSAGRKLWIAVTGMLLIFGLTALFLPALMERAIATWLRYEATRSALRITFRQINARLLRPVEIYDLRVVGAGLHGEHFEINSPRVEAGLRPAALLGQTGGSHAVRWLRIEHARIFLRGQAPGSSSRIDWKALATLLPDAFDISVDQVLLSQRLARFQVRDLRITGGDRGGGSISIAAIEIRAPYLQNRFSDVHGVVRWHDDRLTIGSLGLLDGLTIDALTFDLTRLRATRLGAELSVSVFGGDFRGNFATDASGETRVWETAATASGISLAQLASALGTRESVRGSLRASKFTFRGDPRDLLHATGSIWTELTGFSLRQRNADVVMLGANFYDQSVQLQEFYIKQQQNELTLSGDSALSADWLNPDFRGDISASIGDLGKFAQLFGASANSFGGSVAVRGRVHAHERKVDGELAVTGDNLLLLDNAVDSVTTRLNLDGTRIALEQLELKRGGDLLQASGQMDLAQNRIFKVQSLSLTKGQAVAEFSGNIDLTDVRSWRADLSSNTPLYLDVPEETECIAGIALQDGTDGMPFSRVEFDTQKIIVSDSVSNASRLLTFCESDDTTREPLRIAVPASDAKVTPSPVP